MNNIPLPHFLKMLKFRPKSLIGRQIIYNTIPQKIYDVSLDGRYILLDKGAAGKDWYPVDEYPFNTLDDPVVIDSWPDDGFHTWDDSKYISATMLEKLISQYELERQKKAEEQIEALRKEVADAIQARPPTSEIDDIKAELGKEGECQHKTFQWQTPTRKICMDCGLDITNKEQHDISSLKEGSSLSATLNPEAYIGTNIKEGTTEITMHIQYSEMPFSNLHDLQAKPQKHKYLVVMWDDGEHHEVRFPIYLLEAQSCQK